MKKEKRKMLGLIGAIVSGTLLVACIAAWLGGFDFSRLWRPFVAEYETKLYPIESAFSAVEISVSRADVSIQLSTDGVARLTTRENEDHRFAVRVENGVLHIKCEAERIWSIGIDTGPSMTLALPAAEYAALTVRASSGDIGVAAGLTFGETLLEATSGDIESFAAARGLTVVTSSGDLTIENAGGQIFVKATSGDLSLRNLTPTSLTAKTTSGDLTAENVQADGAVSCKSTSGDVELTGIKGSSVDSATTSGEQNLHSVRAGSVSVLASSGDIELSDVIADGKLSAATTSGSIRLAHADGGELSLESTSGSVRGSLCTPKYYDARSNSGSVSLPSPDPNGGLCYVRTTSGSIHLTIQP